jgi:hypothetical protein
MPIITILCFLMNALASTGTQNISYSVHLNGEKIGVREVTIRYLPASEFQPQGGRVIESWTDLNVVIAGKSQSYRNRVTAQISPSSYQFVSSIGLNGDLLEVQGRRLSSGRWLVNEISTKGKSTSEYRSSEVHNISVALFDPEQTDDWQPNRSQGIFYTEAGDRWVGEWSEGSAIVFQRNGTEISATEHIFQSDKGKLTAVWDDNGLLLSWGAVILGVEVKGEIDTLPEAPDFGNIEVLPTFGTVQEKEL